MDVRQRVWLSTADAHAPIIHRGLRRHRLRIGHLLHYLKVWSCLYLHLLCDLQGVAHLNPQVADGAFELGVSQQEMNRPEILGALVDQRRQVRRVVLPAGEEVIVLSQTCLCDPGRYRRSGGFGDLELYGGAASYAAGLSLGIKGFVREQRR